MDNDNRKHTKVGLIGTLLLHGVILLILWLAFIRAAVPQEESGVPVMLGTELLAKGGGQYNMTEVKVRPVSKPIPAQPKTNPSPVGEKIISQDLEETVAIETKKEKPKKEISPLALSNKDFSKVRVDYVGKKFDPNKKEQVGMIAQEVEEFTGYECRGTILGYVQRGGCPTPEDRLLASRMGAYAVDLLEQGVYGCAVGIRHNELYHMPFDEALTKSKSSKELLDLVSKIQ